MVIKVVLIKKPAIKQTGEHLCFTDTIVSVIKTVQLHHFAQLHFE